MIKSIFLVLVGAFVGAYVNDQATFRDCLIKNEAALVGDITIYCEVKK
jgi:hypothetical protein